MTTQQFIKEHRIVKEKSDKIYNSRNFWYKMVHKEKKDIYVIFSAVGIILKINNLLLEAPEEVTIQNIIINYLDDLYLSKFKKIKSYHEDTTK